MGLFMRSISVVFITAFALLLSACGGSGGGSTQFNQAPIANAGSDQTVFANSTVTLDGSESSDSEDDASTQAKPLSYSWEQTDARNPNEGLNNINLATPSFEAPSVTETTVLEFTLTVTDDNENSSTDIVLITVNVPVKLNDTGITKCSSDPCAGTGEDGEYGRDAQELDKLGAGNAGFDFTKLDANGDTLAANASAWSCVQDNHTGLVWEVKTTSGLHNKGNKYTWYNTDGTTNGGAIGFANATSNCFDDNGNADSFCNTEAFVVRVNSAAFCGANDWRLPNKNELSSIVDFSTVNPAIDSDYFPNTQFGSRGDEFEKYWSSSPYAGHDGYAWVVNFSYGDSNYHYKRYDSYVRLVRGGQ
jgi:hypothetical protein